MKNIVVLILLSILYPLWCGDVVIRNEIATILSHRGGISPIDYATEFKKHIDKDKYIGNYQDDIKYIENKLSQDLALQRSGMQACGFYADQENVDHIISTTTQSFKGFDFSKHRDYLNNCNAAIAKNGECREGVLWVFNDTTKLVTMVFLTYETKGGKIVLAQKLE